MHVFRRLNWRQAVGATPIEAQKAAGHAWLDMTLLYTQTDEAREREHVARILDRLKSTSKRAALKTEGGCSERGELQPKSSENKPGISTGFLVTYWQMLIRWWARGDSNARPLPCQGKKINKLETSF